MTWHNRWLLLRLLVATAGKAAAQRSLPIYLGILMLVLVLFGGTGLSPSTIAGFVESSVVVRVLCYASWVLVSVPAVRELLLAEGLSFLRALPIRQGELLGMQALLVMGAEMPWILLWLVGSGWLEALAATSAVMTCSAVVVARFRGTRLWLAFGGVVLALLADAPPAVMLAVGAVGASVAFHTAFRLAPESHLAEAKPRVAGRAVVALTLTYLVLLYRHASSRLVRSVALTVLGMGLARLVVSNWNPSSSAERDVLIMIVMTFPVTFSLTGLLGPLFLAETRLAWLLAVCGASPFRRISTILLVMGIIATLQGVAHGFVVGSWLEVPNAEVAMITGKATATAWVASLWIWLLGRWAIRSSGRDAIRLVLGASLLAGALSLSLHSLGPLALAGWSFAAVMLISSILLRRQFTDCGDETVLERKRAVLEVKNLTKRLGHKLVLSNLELSCAIGEVCVVLGQNGAGKSTLLRVVSGIVEPDGGYVWVDGNLLNGGKLGARRRLGYVPDAADALPDLLVSEFVALVRALKGGLKDAKGNAALRQWRERLGLAEAWNRRFSTLSFGQRKRACTLAALVGDPVLLMMDEPSNGLDPNGIDLMAQIIGERQAAGQTTLLTSNDLPFVDRLRARKVMMQEGQLQPA